MTDMVRDTPWGPTGELVYRRSYARVNADGSPEQWPDTVRRVVDGNLALVGPQHHLPYERRRLEELFMRFAALPAGRHLWMSGVSGRQFLFNCHVAGWDGNDPAAHFCFLFNQLMQGGGVGANYSDRFMALLPAPHPAAEVHLVCDDGHDDIAELRPHLSPDYSHQWPGSVRVDDSREGWVDALRSVLERFWNGGGDPLVLDLSLLRARGAPIRTFGGTASGPGPLAKMLAEVAAVLRGRIGNPLSSLDAMLIDHRIAEAVVAGNVRRSARMSMKHWADPDIADFIGAKADPLVHWSTNVSVELDDGFFEAIAADDPHATTVFEGIVDGMLRNGEPGVWNRSLAQAGERGEVVCTNPCGEIALEEWENCNLGHINLRSFAGDLDGAVDAHRLMARFLLRATFGDVPDERQRAALTRNRRIGVGHFGYQGW
ncbi:MAG: ribonucleoside-triphosphate reductase, adenosylcobalamin-dependent, partial [Ilumatobacteraceae bacterium]